MTDLDESLLSDKVCKLLGTQRVYKEGLLYKRQRGLHGNQKKLKFQERFCRLTQVSLDYYDPNPKKRDCPKGQFAVNQIRIIESMPPVTFGKDYLNLHPFQVGDNSEIMYFSTKSLAEREEWLLAFRKAARDNCNRMLPFYHKGIFGLTLKSRWGCCGSPQRASPGCSPTPERQPPPLTPQPHRTMSIMPEEFSKPRAGTIADFLMSEAEGKVQADGGGVAGRAGGAAGNPQNSPRIRSFTLIAPMRSKPDPKKLRENENKRSTMEFEYWDSDKREPEREELLKKAEELESEVKKKPEQWNSDLASELKGHEEGKRASSPSPSEDSGKGTSTGSSRPSSQVISTDTEDGMRPSRSWSTGKSNALSPLADQTAPREGSSAGENKTAVGTSETDGQTHSSVKRVPSSAAGEGGKVGSGEGEKGEDEDVMGRELEDTLKASDHKRMMRNMSSPPGINYDGDSNRPLTQTETRDVHLRSKIQTSQSLDTLAKRNSLQLPPSPLVMKRFDFPPTPTHSSHSNRLSKASTTSSSPQLKSRQSIMMQSGLVVDRPDATLRRRRTIEEFSPLHRACHDGNVSALWDMLNGSELADLEEPSFGAIPYTPLFLTFMSDHFQTMVCLLEHGANPDATEPLYRAPVLHWASERGCTDIVDLLLRYNADVNQVDSRGNTALWQACRSGHLDIVEPLLKHGAKVNTEGENHRTPLHEAALAGHVTITERLIQAGANPCPRDNHDATPYDLAYAQRRREVMQMLQQLIPEALRPYSLLHSHLTHSHQMVTCLVFTDNETLVSGSRDCHATLWEVGEEELSVQRSVKQQDSVLGVGQWAENLVISSTFVTVNSLTDSNQRRIVADDTQEDESLTNPPLHLASFGPEGLLVTASVESHVVKIWPPMASRTSLAMEPKTRLAVGVSKETPEPGIIHSLSVSQSVEHPWMAVGLQPGALFQPQGNKAVHLYNLRDGTLHQIFDAGNGGLSVSVHTVFAPCGRQLAVGCHENLCVWEPKTGDLLYKFTTANKSPVTSLCYSPNGAHLVAGLASGEIQVFASDIESNSCIFTLEPDAEYPSATTAVAYSENGRLLAAGHRNGQIHIWEAYTGPPSS